MTVQQLIQQVTDQEVYRAIGNINRQLLSKLPAFADLLKRLASAPPTTSLIVISYDETQYEGIHVYREDELLHAFSSLSLTELAHAQIDVEPTHYATCLAGLLVYYSMNGLVFDDAARGKEVDKFSSLLQ